MDTTNNLDYSRLLNLNQKVTNKTATKAERDELMLLLLRNNSITRKQYDDYSNNRNVEDITQGALVIAGIILLGYLLDKAFSK